MRFDMQMRPSRISGPSDPPTLRPSDQRKVLEGIEQHLTFQPKFVGRNRIKLMTQPFWSQYRLRLDDVRVYYDVVDDPPTVNVLRVLIKTTGTMPEESP